MKENDWLVAGLNSPDLSTNDFILAGLNISNTQLLTPDLYKKSEYIRDKFTLNGVFNESVFDQFYKYKATQFGQLLTADTSDTFQYDPFDPRSVGKKNIKSPNFKVEQVANTNRETTLFSGQVFDDDYSWRERAQLSKIWDSAKQKWSDESPNDQALVKGSLKWISSLFDDPLVYAQYESDGEHYDLFKGVNVKHKKGDLKTNLFGLPYTETLNGRSLIGKEVVSKFDTITVDKEGIDRYNFFDSDDVDKSTAGTIAKSAVAIAPMLVGGPVASIYSGIMVGRELLKTLPMLYGMFSSIVDVEPENKTLNKLAGIALGLTGSVSDAGKSSILNKEQFFNMFTDVALQYGLLLVIAKSISKLRGSNTLMDEAMAKSALSYTTLKHVLEELAKKGIITQEALARYIGNPEKWQESAIGKAAILRFTKLVEPIIARSRTLGADASLAYMALVSNTDVYLSMLEAGASRKEAAAVTLGSTLGMFSVDKYLHLGELFFDDLTADYERQIRRTLTKEAKSWYENTIKYGATDPNVSGVNKLKKLISSGMNIGRKATSQFAENLKYHSTGFWGKALGEGIEEVSEELVTDLSKSIYQLAGLLGFDTTVKDVGAFLDWVPRYGMSLLGGAVGGGLFYGVGVYQKGTFSVDLTLDELIYLARNGRTKEALNMLDDFHKKGKLGSTSLSIDTTTDESGQKVFVTADKNHLSLNDFVYNRLKETINQLDNIINENRANLSEDLLFEKMILSDVRFNSLKDWLLDLSYSTHYLEDYQNALKNVINLEAELDKASKTLNGRANEDIATDESLRNMTDELKVKRSENLLRLRNGLVLAREHLNNFLSGVYSAEYVEKMLFALDPELNQDFVAMTYDLWLEQNHDGKTPEELTLAEATQYKQEYLDYKKNLLGLDLNYKFNIYKKIKELMDPILLNVQLNQEAFIKFQDEFSRLRDEDSPIFNVRNYNFDDVLDFMGETEQSDSYVNRNSEENRDARIDAINTENQKQLEQYRDAILKIIDDAGGFIDPNSRRELSLLINNRNKDILSIVLDLVSEQMKESNTLVNTETGEVLKAGELSDLDSSVLQLLQSIDMEDPNKTWDLIESIVKEKYVKKYKNFNSKVDSSYSYLLDLGILDPSNPYIGSQLKAVIDKQLANGKTLDDIITDLTRNDAGMYDLLTNADVATLATTIVNEYNVGTLESFDLQPVDILQSIESDLDALSDINYYHQIYQDYLDLVKNNAIIQLNNELDSRVKEINPVVDLIKALGLKLNTDMNNLESILDKLDKRYQQAERIDDFILTSEEEESLEEAEYIFKLAKSYIYAASNKANIFSPFGHNTTLNDFAHNNKGVYPDFQDLPVLQLDVADMYSYELDRYLWLVGQLDSRSKQYNVGSWRYLSNLNKINKAKQHIEADKAWNAAFYSFFNSLYKSGVFQFDYNGKHYDLLEGFDSIPEVSRDTADAAVYNNLIADLFYNKIRTLIDEGWTYKLIWERSGLFTKMLDPKQIVEQKTSSLNLDITNDILTQYDKMVILLTTAGVNSTQFYDYLQKRINEEDNIAPLTILEWVSRVGVAYMNNPEVFNSTLKYIQELTNSDKPIVFGLYVGGDAGSGKSSVVGKNIVTWTDSSNIWLSAPKQSQANTLFAAVGKGIKMTNREDIEGSKSLFSRLGIDMAAYQAALSHVTAGKDTSPYYSVKNNGESDVLRIDASKFNIHKIDNAPDAIVIDEVTHLSALELQILSEFSQLNGTRLIFLGDDKQKGFSQIGRNIDRESILTIRTPNLGISLRDNNAQHQYNLNVISNLIKLLLDLDAYNPDYKMQVATIKSLLSSTKFKVYNVDDINGDLFSKTLTEELVGLMNGTIGFVGNLNSATLQLLKQLKGDKVTILPETDIQGQEFDYVVIDKDWKIPDGKTSDAELLDFLQDVYTMISRGRKGSIIIDQGVLQSTLGENKVENTKALAQNVASYTLKFRENKLNIINKILANRTAEAKPTNELTVLLEAPEEEPAREDLRTVEEERPEESKPTEEDQLYSDLDDSLSDPEEISVDSPENPMLCYGQATMTGLLVEMRDGREVWLNPNDGLKRDLQIFTNKQEISDTQELIDLSRKLRTLKNSILYNKGYESMPFKDLISEEAYNNIKWSIEVREQNAQDNFIRNIGFKNDKLGIGPKGLVFSIVGEIELSDGSKATITLGLMADPKTWIDANSKNKKRITRKMDKLKNQLMTQLGLTEAQKLGIKDKITNYEERLKKLDLNDPNSDPRQYESYISLITEQYQGSPIRIPIPRIITPGMTDLHRLDKAIRISRKSKAMIANIDERLATLRQLLNKTKENSLLKMKLNGEIKKLEEKKKQFQEIKDSSFRSINPYTVVSPMYIYAPNGQHMNVDDSVIGRCNVVFVTNDPDLGPDLLVDVYMQLKNAAALEEKNSGVTDLKNTKVTPRVRMVVLNNLGVSFLDLSNPYLAESMHSELRVVKNGKEYVLKQIFPFKTNFTGVRMYVGLWNFRANLLQFLDKVSKFVKTLPIEESQLDLYLTAKDLLWRKDNGKRLSAQEKAFLSENSLLENFELVVKMVDEFNDSLHNLVKEFRLGSSLDNGAYVRLLTGDLSVFYDTSKRTPNGIYLNIATLDKYLGIAESLFSSVLDEIVTCDYSKDRLLSTKENAKNSFAHHISALANADGLIEITDGNTGEELTINFGSSYDSTGSKGILNTFSHIPAVLSKVFKYTSIRQRHLNGASFDESGDYSIKIKGTVKNDEGVDVEIDKPIKYQRLWKYVDMIQSADEYDIDAINGYTFDPTLSNFFSFAFHGTLESVESSAQRASDALFPKGFFADPLSTTETANWDGNKMFIKAQQQLIFFGADVRVGDPTFFVSMSDIKQGLEEFKKPKPVLNGIKEDCVNLINKAISNYPMLEQALTLVLEELDSISDENKVEYVQSSIEEELMRIVTSNFEGLFRGTIKRVNPDMLFFSPDPLTALTFSETISMVYRDLFGEQLPPIDNISISGKDIIVDAGDVSVKVNKGMRRTITLLKIGTAQTQDSVVVSGVSDIINKLKGEVDLKVVELLQKLLDVYKSLDDSKKIQAKAGIIKKLQGISTKLSITSEMHEPIDELIDKLKTPSCL